MKQSQAEQQSMSCCLTMTTTRFFSCHDCEWEVRVFFIFTGRPTLCSLVREGVLTLDPPTAVKHLPLQPNAHEAGLDTE